MKQKLNTVISESGIWKGTRAQSHGFLLSPSIYTISDAQHQELDALGPALYECLTGLSFIACVAYNKEINCRGTWHLFRQVFSTGVPKMYQDLQGIYPKRVPRLLKVDFMVDQEGNFKIAEIDGHNKHGLGYSTLGLRFRTSLYPDARCMDGVVRKLSIEIRKNGYDEIKLLYADQERFYIPEFEVAEQEFKKNGITCKLVSEMDATEEFVRDGLFLDLPFLYRQPHLYEIMIESYKNHRVRFIIPPKPFLGAKGVLALLRNDSNDKQIESILLSFISESSLRLVRSFIPETYLVGKSITVNMSRDPQMWDKRFILKESISSGMKGTHFSDSDGFAAVLDKAFKSNLNWVLQEEVINKPQSFSWYRKGESVLQQADDWFMRVTGHYVDRSLADVIVTSRRDKSVHGAKDCIQIGTIIV